MKSWNHEFYPDSPTEESIGPFPVWYLDLLNIIYFGEQIYEALLGQWLVIHPPRAHAFELRSIYFFTSINSLLTAPLGVEFPAREGRSALCRESSIKRNGSTRLTRQTSSSIIEHTSYNRTESRVHFLSGHTNVDFPPIIDENQTHNHGHNRSLIGRVDRTYCDKERAHFLGNS
jgi:hypothetical protein